MMKSFPSLLLITFVFLQVRAAAQDIKTDIYLLKIGSSKKKISIEKTIPLAVTEAYENQPFFAGDSAVYFVRRYGKQTDIVSYNLAAERERRVTFTEIDEFSPSISPDGKFLTCVVVEKDSSQLLYNYSFSGQFIQRIGKKLDSVGYYTYLSPTIMGYVKITQPLSVLWAYLPLDTSFRRCSHAGRCVASVPKQPLTLSFVDKTHKSAPRDAIFTIDAKGHLKLVTETLEGSEDYAWKNEHTLLMGRGGKLYSFDLRKKKRGWQQVADFRGTPYENFYRISLSADGKYMALVTYSGQKP